MEVEEEVNVEEKVTKFWVSRLEEEVEEEVEVEV